MNQINNYLKVNFFRSLFKGREDILAVRWEKSEKSEKSGYMPAYQYDQYH